ncbi:hypothetical protein [Acidiplasma cupricumulans]|nr:hypothetical protein [Acidiplasma cupricumulans]
MERNDDVKTNFLENLKQLIDFKKINVIDVIKKFLLKDMNILINLITTI